jgi:hypothetical protein
MWRKFRSGSRPGFDYGQSRLDDARRQAHRRPSCAKFSHSIEIKLTKVQMTGADSALRAIRERPFLAQRTPSARAVFERIESEGDSRIGGNLIQHGCWRRRPAGMAEPLSVDLRKRVVEAIKGGMSRRRAAAHFQIGVSSAIAAARGL